MRNADLLIEFGRGIWIASGPVLTAAAGFHYPTRMAVIRLTNNELAVWSPVEMSDDLRADLAALGTVRHVLAPNSLHHTFFAEWRQAYPDALFYAAPGLREKRPDIRFDRDLTGDPVTDFGGEIDLVVVRGNRITTEVVFFHHASRTAIFTDLLQNFPAGWFRGWRAVVARLDLMLASEPSVPRKFRLGFTDKRAARSAVAQILTWPSEKVLMAHGEPVTANGQAYLRQAFGWLIAN